MGILSETMHLGHARTRSSFGTLRDRIRGEELPESRREIRQGTGSLMQPVMELDSNGDGFIDGWEAAAIRGWMDRGRP